MEDSSKAHPDQILLKEYGRISKKYSSTKTGLSFRLLRKKLVDWGWVDVLDIRELRISDKGTETYSRHGFFLYTDEIESMIEILIQAQKDLEYGTHPRN